MCFNHREGVSRRQVLKNVGFLGMGLGAGIMSGCRTAPTTGRPQLMIVPEQQELSLGNQAFQEKLDAEQRSSDQRNTEIVNRVGQRIASVLERSDYDWEFVLFSGPTRNAFCLPGGKVAIYEGILSVCEDEAGLAVVMSHEIAHALARHGGERMSQSLAVDGAKMLAEKLAGKYAPDRKEILMQAYGVGSKYGVLLPYSRKQESEADHIGVLMMAKAGYDPAAAPSFWMRFGAVNEGGQVPEFMSTHPNDSRRASDLKELLPEARLHYQQASHQFGQGESLVVHPT